MLNVSRLWSWLCHKIFIQFRKIEINHPWASFFFAFNFNIYCWSYLSKLNVSKVCAILELPPKPTVLWGVTIMDVMQKPIFPMYDMTRHDVHTMYNHYTSRSLMYSCLKKIFENIFSYTEIIVKRPSADIKELSNNNC